MKLSALLAQREILLRQARLASLALACATLEDFANRITRAGLAGRVRLQGISPEAERFWPALTALDGNQSVIEEHFADEDVLHLADILGYLTGAPSPDLTFRLEELTERFLVPVRDELARGGVEFDRDLRTLAESNDT